MDFISNSALHILTGLIREKLSYSQFFVLPAENGVLRLPTVLCSGFLDVQGERIKEYLWKKSSTKSVSDAIWRDSIPRTLENNSRRRGKKTI